MRSVVHNRPAEHHTFDLANRISGNNPVGMRSYELLREVLESSNPKEIASELGLSLSTIYKWAEPPHAGGSGIANPLDRIAALIRSTGDTRIAQWVCEQSGGFFIKNPRAMWSHSAQLVPATNQVVQEFADLLSVIAKAAIDNAISREEAAAIRARWEDLKSVTEGFVRCCEQGNFAPMRRSMLQEHT
ncbi:MAG: hypothetical protein N3G20_12200 [Verrucomicrobiae bacterium]|nr:hypothetical protein [Verrucomicrobiae bacterium]